MKKLYLTSFTIANQNGEHQEQRVVVVTKEDRDAYLNHNKIVDYFDLNIASIKVQKFVKQYFPDSKLVAHHVHRAIDLGLDESDAIGFSNDNFKNVMAALSDAEAHNKKLYRMLTDKAAASLTPDEFAQFEVVRNRVL